MTSNNFQSREHRDLLDIIDKLRSQGISKYVDLPEIIVCGDQSSGKSSVLEAISGMTFPTKDNLCTRFATELILRRTPDTNISCTVSIIPDSERPETEKSVLKAFSPDVDMDTLDLGSVIEHAKEIMGLSETKRFSNDILRVELCGPSQPHLTMVDLPGLFSSGSKEQSIDDAETVRGMVQTHMRRPRSIIIAVVSAKNDLVNQLVPKMIREIDPDGSRTMGLITKPDMLHPGSESESFYVKLAQNKDIQFRHGWHVLRNRDYPERNSSSEERNRRESEFFSKHLWASMDPKQLGVAALKPRLSNILREQILLQLPSLLKDIESGIAECENRLRLLGTPRSTLSQQRRYLIHVSREFSRLAEAAVQGTYTDPFFGDALTDEGAEKRLRAVVQNTLTDFSSDMALRGKSRWIVDDDEKYEGEVEAISRNDYIKEVEQLMRKSRGRELSGTFNPLIIGDLFVQQCQPWKRLAEGCLDKVVGATHVLINHILDEVTAPETRYSILHRINDGMEKVKSSLDQKTSEILAHHYKGHPLTYNKYLTTTVQRLQEQRRKKNLEKFLRVLVGDHHWGSTVKINPSTLLDSLSNHMEESMEDFASSSAIDYLEAYFEVRLNI